MQTHCLGISSNEVHLWITLPDLFPDHSAALDFYRSFLSIEERKREKNLFSHKTRREYLITRVFCRTLLSYYAPIPPRLWAFQTNPYGRPEIANPDYNEKICFNISHTEGLIVCLVAAQREVGVDVEFIDWQVNDIESIAKTMFSKKEFNQLNTMTGRSQKKRFFQYWTLKESYIKARGFGLHFPLAEFSYDLATHEVGRISISFSEKMKDNPDEWQFALLQPTPRHQLALSIHKGKKSDLQIIQKHLTPHECFEESSIFTCPPMWK